MLFDAVVCVGPQNRDIALKTVQSLKMFSDCRQVIVITSRRNFPAFQPSGNRDNRLRLMDEDQVAPGLTLETVKDILRQRIGSGERAGWYFQQFLKMSVSYRPDITDYYLLWDGDTIMLRKMHFFSREMTLVGPKTEYHKPYFKTMKKLLGIDRQVDFSFISEHFMVKTAFMRELIRELNPEGRLESHRPWITRVLDHVEDGDLTGAGFSEYETYGNFLAVRHPQSFVTRAVKSLRFGSAYYGMIPDKYDLARLMYLGLDFTTFEAVDRAGPLSIAGNKLLSRIRALYYVSSPDTRQLLRQAAQICEYHHKELREQFLIRGALRPRELRNGEARSGERKPHRRLR